MGCKTVSSCEHPACHTILNRELHKLSENVKTVQVSGQFCKILSTESPLIEMLLNYDTGIEPIVPGESKQ